MESVPAQQTQKIQALTVQHANKIYCCYDRKSSQDKVPIQYIIFFRCNFAQPIKTFPLTRPF